MDKYERMLLAGLSPHTDFIKAIDLIVSLGVTANVALVMGDKLQTLADTGLIQIRRGTEVKITLAGRRVLAEPH